MSKLEQVIQAQHDGIIDLEDMPISEIQRILVQEDILESCSTQTVGAARKAFGIRIGQRSARKPFKSTSAWNDERRKLLENWSRP